MKKDILEIKKYWDKRAQSLASSPRATTNDYWLRMIEIREIKKVLSQIKKKNNILDIGCGDGFSTINIFRSFLKSSFLGGDYSENMIKNAKNSLKCLKIKSPNIEFEVLDVLEISKMKKKFDVVISDRCIINLSDKNTQKKAIKEIWDSLNKEGYYIMIENFIEGHNMINKIRKRLGLKDIDVRWHNNFLDEKMLNNSIAKYFEVITRKNISSIYYLITRAVYSKICQYENREPDYDNIIYKIAYDIDECVGNYGPINLLLLKKK
jgi:ubiquinone/menaquinone biosynthesis C-methylase UbiE